MHIPDGYLSLQTTIPAVGAMVPVWTIALNKIKKTLSSKQIPLLSLCAAFSFIIMMFNIPIGQSSVHAVGAVFIAILLGPWAACIAVSVALAIQALVFGDGGILSFGINCFNMAFIMTFIGFITYRIVAGKSHISSKRSITGIFLGSYLGINIAALLTAIEFGIQPLLFKGADGNPLYGYYPLSVSVPTMAFEHVFFAGPIEGIITVAAVMYLVKFAPQLLFKNNQKKSETNISFFKTYKPFIIFILILLVLTPLGLFATGTAWGEWGVNELKEKIGYIPEGFGRFSDIWRALIPDYVLEKFSGGVFKASLGYIISAIVGVVLITVVILLTARLIVGKGSKTNKKLLWKESTVAEPVNSGLKVPGWMTEENSLNNGFKKSNTGFLKRTVNEIAKVIRNDIFSEKSAVKNKIIQKIDPRLKLITFIFLMIFAGLSRSLFVLALLVLTAILYTKLSDLNLMEYFKRVWLVIPLIMFVISIPAATNLFFKGRVLFYVYRNLHFSFLFIKLPEEIYFTLNGMEAILRMAVRIGVSFSFGYLLVMTTRWIYLLRAFEALKVPSLIISIINLTYRYIYILSKLTMEMMEARYLRTIGYIDNKQNREYISGRISFLFIKASFLSEEIYDSMKCRGFTGKNKSLKKFKIQISDIKWIIINLLIISIFMIGERIF